MTIRGLRIWIFLLGALAFAGGDARLEAAGGPGDRDVRAAAVAEAHLDATTVGVGLSPRGYASESTLDVVRGPWHHAAPPQGWRTIQLVGRDLGRVVPPGPRPLHAPTTPPGPIESADILLRPSSDPGLYESFHVGLLRRSGSLSAYATSLPPPSIV